MTTPDDLMEAEGRRLRDLLNRQVRTARSSAKSLAPEIGLSRSQRLSDWLSATDRPRGDLGMVAAAFKSLGYVLTPVPQHMLAESQARMADAAAASEDLLDLVLIWARLRHPEAVVDAALQVASGNPELAARLRKGLADT